MGWGGVGWVGSNSDYKAISVQLQLQLPTGTELGNKQASEANIWILGSPPKGLECQGARRAPNFKVSYNIQLKLCPSKPPEAPIVLSLLGKS